MLLHELLLPEGGLNITISISIALHNNITQNPKKQMRPKTMMMTPRDDDDDDHGHAHDELDLYFTSPRPAK